MTSMQVSAGVTESMSLAAVRNFMRAAVSCITFSRGLCSDESFFPYQFAGVEMQQLCGQSPEGAQLISWLNDGAFDALNKKYLKEMALCVLSVDGTETLESYCFTITYATDGADRAAVHILTGGSDTQNTQTAANSERRILASTPDSNVAEAGALLSAVVPAATTARKKRTTAQIVQDMRQLFSHLGEQISLLPPLLPDRVVTMRLVYNDHAPASYQPPNFQSASASMSALYRRELRSELPLGSVDAKYLAVSAAIRHPLYQIVKQSALESQYSGAATTTADAATASSLTRPSASTGTAGVNVSSKAVTGMAAAAPACATQRKTASTSVRSHGQPRETEVTTARSTFAVSASQLSALRPVDALVSTSKVLRPAEVCFLVFTAFVFTKAPALRGGHAELSLAEIQRYLRQECVFRDVPLETFLPVVTKLCKHGLMVPAATRPEEWLVCDPPALLVSQLRCHPQVSMYLSSSDVALLTDLEERRADDDGHGRQSGQPTKRLATARKRRREAAPTAL